MTDTRVTQAILEVAERPTVVTTRATQVFVELAASWETEVTQVIAEVAFTPPTFTQVTQAILELASVSVLTRITQVIAEASTVALTSSDITQVVLEVGYESPAVPVVPPIFASTTSRRKDRLRQRRIDRGARQGVSR